MSHFLEYKRIAANHFSISKHICWGSYVYGYSEEKPFIENISPEFVIQMMQSGQNSPRVENEPLPGGA
ncbi:hypothetical protein DPMN_154104 [Dreissena polymorpha]|uniref:Uncharacterized protein n=1 Tax=Dreissena polymorpha TaxID=45954 RepID=A0A9D4FPB1_DREPO|nr:hypothetical protein DPMN_154104 [Dreissena polymorpha]